MFIFEGNGAFKMEKLFAESRIEKKNVKARILASTLIMKTLTLK